MAPASLRHATGWSRHELARFRATAVLYFPTAGFPSTAQAKQSWGSIDRPCLYHPREFYSGEATRAAATLKELMKTPQNKLRAWENGNMLFGAGSGSGDDEEGEGGETAGEVALGKAVTAAGLAGGDG